MPAKRHVVAFDIIGTVFSLESMRPRLALLGLGANALETWFAAGLRDAFALAATDRFAPFRSVLENALADVLAKHGLEAPRDRIGEVVDGLKALEPQRDAAEAFRTLKAAGLRIIALSNGAVAATEALLKGAQLDDFVERVISVDEVKLSKPRREVYLHAAKASGVAPGDLALVATHPWDIHGAKVAGLAAGFVSRGQPYPTTMAAPDFTGEELIDAARILAAVP